MKTLQSVALGYRQPNAADYSLQVTSWLGAANDPDNHTSVTMSFPSKKAAMAFAKGAGMKFHQNGCN